MTRAFALFLALATAVAAQTETAPVPVPPPVAPAPAAPPPAPAAPTAPASAAPAAMAGAPASAPAEGAPTAPAPGAAAEATPPPPPAPLPPIAPPPVKIPAVPQLPAGAPPNIVLILIDDMGWTDLGCYGSKYYETPHIDQLAREGMRFTQAYSACTVCSPTRAALLTGKTPARLHITDWIAGHVPQNGRLAIPNWTQHLPLEEETLAERLKTRGYATASIGKWHLGEAEFGPTKQGFDINLGGTDKGSPPSYFSPYKIATLKDGPKDEFLTDRLTEEAVNFMEKNKSRPFFIYLPHYAVHTPIQGKPDVVAKYQAKAADKGHSNPVYAALVESVDDGVGRLRAKLQELNLAQNTIFIFTSDNGGLANQVTPQGWTRGPTDNSPARLGKGSAYEGGVHIPLIITWPGVVQPGSTCDVPVISYDHVPTLLAATQTPLKDKQVVDGESLLPLLGQTDTLAREAIHWHYPHYHPGSARPYSAIREGDWKLILFHEDNHVELYNLKLDPGEADNRASFDSVKAMQLREKLLNWLETSGAQIPEKNAKYDPDKPLNEPKHKGAGKQGGKNKDKEAAEEKAAAPAPAAKAEPTPAAAAPAPVPAPSEGAAKSAN